MTMNSFRACVVVLLLAAPVAFGSIVTVVDYSYEDSGGTGFASSGSQSSGTWATVNGNASSGWAGSEGEYVLETTENATCNWSCYVYVYASAEADEVDGYVNAYAFGSADTYTPFGDAEVPDAEAHVTSTGTDSEGPYSDSASGTDYFSGLYRRCRANHETAVSAVVDYGSDSTASAHGCVMATVNMSLN